MKRFNRFFAAFLVALLLASLSACVPNLAVAEVTPTQQLTAAPTATPTATPEPTATPVPTLSPEEIEDVNQRFADFLNGEGEYTDEKTQKLIFRFPGEKNRDLGYISTDEFSAQFQGVLLFNQEVPIGQVFAIGCKDKEGNRTIVVYENPFKFFEDENLTVAVIQCVGRSLSGDNEVLFLRNREEINEYYRSYIGKVGIFETNVKENNDPNYNESQKRMAANFALKCDINRDMITSMFVSGSFTSDYNPEWLSIKGAGLYGVSDIESFYQRILESDKLPSIMIVYFYDN